MYNYFSKPDSGIYIIIYFLILGNSYHLKLIFMSYVRHIIKSIYFSVKYKIN